jgi:hypothetical protein
LFEVGRVEHTTGVDDLFVPSPGDGELLESGVLPPLRILRAMMQLVGGCVDVDVIE